MTGMKHSTTTLVEVLVWGGMALFALVLFGALAIADASAWLIVVSGLASLASLVMAADALFDWLVYGKDSYP